MAANYVSLTAMAETAEKLMSVDEFLVWGEGLEGKWELHDGVPVCMSPERVLHVRVKYRVTRLFEDALEKSDSPCRFAVDGLSVRINERKSFTPDSLVYC
ncbi:MAG: Uma2 family endonuclease, partial [Hyphomicrobiaceae bacterium]|nr:Uma2 family endonuclease [Hyphomicrobiaceae bacterium]